jgi:hypothetical protein
MMVWRDNLLKIGDLGMGEGAEDWLPLEHTTWPGCRPFNTPLHQYHPLLQCVCVKGGNFATLLCYNI